MVGAVFVSDDYGEADLPVGRHAAHVIAYADLRLVVFVCRRCHARKSLGSNMRKPSMTNWCANSCRPTE